ncbi:histidine phosphatase family protein [Breznakiella homolactica]|uniref:phosphoglycerate mutase (2,3-diphosphoglycerate-dependent) n=1 Tax=Breznakiella homolactica TaxID=2798577 RepID=A0A7T8BBY2_9SPIR|nr:histidine phosphatase family protein [Breznakiella homolactica]QQO11042.1 histidine phosphatase family protein [Breznakiella homolactica]
MAVLYFIRHAESEANSKRILASQLPFPLTEEGKREAELIASQFREITGLDRIISSPLLRAVQTAEPFGRRYGLPVGQDIRLAEQHLGIFSGMTYDEVKSEPDYRQDPMDRWNWVPRGGGESYEMIAQRVCNFLSEFNGDAGNNKNYLIVTHAVVFRLIRGALENTLPGYPKAFPNNGEIWKVDFTGLGNKHAIESLFLGNSRDFTHNP